MLVDSCMHRFGSNARKVVCYFAAQHLGVHAEWLAVSEIRSCSPWVTDCAACRPPLVLKSLGMDWNGSA